MELHKKKKWPSDNPRLPQPLGDARRKAAPSSSIWNWKPLRALSSHVRNRRFNCCFTLHVHSIESLPPALDGAALRVHWRRHDGGLETAPARVAVGAAEFDEAMSYCCVVYGSRSGPRHAAKYEAKHFLLYASVVGRPEVDLGRHRVDLCRLLPLTLEELEEEKGDGAWTTGFRLAGVAKGAVLNVSFSFVVAKDERKGFLLSSSSGPSLVGGRGEVLRRVGSTAARFLDRSVDDVRVLLEVLPTTKSDVARSMVDVHEVLPRYQSEVACLKKSEPKPSIEGKLAPFINGWEDAEFSVVEKGVESVVKIGSNLDCGFTANDSLLASVELDERDRKEEVEIGDHVDLAKDELLGGVEFGEIGSRDGVEMGEDILVDDSLLGTVTIDDDIGECEQKVVQEDVCIGEEVEEEKGHELDKMVGVDELDCALQGLSVFDSGGLGSPPAIGGVGDYAEVEFNDKERKVDEEKSHELHQMASVDGLDSPLQGLSVFHDEGLGSPPAMGGAGDYAEAKFNDKLGKAGEPHRLDDTSDSIASEFLNMLGIEHSPFRFCSESDPESPRERLLKQFEMECLAAGGGLFGLDIGEEFEQVVVDDFSGNLDHGDVLQGLGFSSFVQEGEEEHQKFDFEMKSKTRAKMMEDLETEVLMREWGLNETAFQSSPAERANGFGSPIDLPPENPLELPPLAEGLGPCLQTKDGGFLRSMSPSLFRSSKNNSGLIMQISSPVVVPAEMGSGVMEILQGLASVGIEKLSVQANKLMPLEDITGKSMQQVAWEALPSLEASERLEALQQRNQDCASNYYGHVAPIVKKRSGRSLKVNFSSHNSDLDSEYVSLEELAPLAMNKIEALSLEGLRIQSGMSNEDAPSNICAQSCGDVSALEGVRAKSGGLLGLEGAAGLQLLDMKSGKEDVDGLMGLSLTLDEWMRLDAGMVDEDEQDDGRTSKILAAHHAHCTSKDLVNGRWRGGKGKRWGLLGNNFTVALMVQLRDPLRNYEPVGTPMLSLIQVERVFVPPKPKIYGTVSNKIRTEDSDDESEQGAADKENEMKVKPEADLIPQFKITDVHVAGIKTEPAKKKLWGNSKQQQSGSRWLVASGMGKKNKHPLMKSKAVTESSPVATTTVQPGDTLWSISSRVHGNGTKWKELAALNPHIRNPNVIFPNQTIRLR